MSERKAHPGPGPKGSPRRPVARRWSQGAFTYAELTCGHVVRLTKEWIHQDLDVPCPLCPRSKR